MRARSITALAVPFAALFMLSACGGGLAAPKAAYSSRMAADDAEAPGTEQYTNYGVNPVTDPAKDRLSTFAIDVDTASYAIARRKIIEGTMPPQASVRVEEFLNYF